jgi:hypothetical protein
MSFPDLRIAQVPRISSVKAPSDVHWLDGSRFPLSDPIIEAGLEDLIDNRRMEKLREVCAHWARLDRENCDLVRRTFFGSVDRELIGSPSADTQQET